MIKVSISDRLSLVSFYSHFWTMIFDLKLGNIKDCAKYVVSLDQLHSFMCFAIIKGAVLAICPFTRFSLTMHNYSFQNGNRITKIKTLFV